MSGFVTSVAFTECTKRGVSPNRRGPKIGIPFHTVIKLMFW